MKILLWTMVSLLLISCVSKSKYTELVEKHKSEMAVMDEKLIDSQRQLALSLQDKDKLKVDLLELAEYKKQAEGRIEEFKRLTGKFRSLIDAGRLKVKMIEGRMVVVLSTDILFDSGSAKLKKEAVSEIEQISLVLKDLDNKSFQIAGHTDNVPMKSKYNITNWDLAFDRAYSVIKTMIGSGFPRERVSISSYGETKPIINNSSRENRALNRRIEIVVVPDLSSLPGNGIFGMPRPGSLTVYLRCFFFSLKYFS